MNQVDIDKLDWEKGDGLIPAVVQNVTSGEVLMLGYMNRESLAQTLKTGDVTFFSRSKQRLWVKGESSGHYLRLIKVSCDCDQDSLLVQVKPEGATCHLGNVSCFKDAASSDWQVLAELQRVIDEQVTKLPAESYTATLMKKGLNFIAQKVGEEAVETVIASLVEDNQPFCNEVADLLYHLLVLLRSKGIPFSEVMGVLKARREKKLV